MTYAAVERLAQLEADNARLRAAGDRIVLGHLLSVDDGRRLMVSDDAG